MKHGLALYPNVVVEFHHIICTKLWDEGCFPRVKVRLAVAHMQADVSLSCPLSNRLGGGECLEQQVG